MKFGKKESSLDRVLGQIDSLDTINLTNLVKKLARERELLETIFNTALEGILVISDLGVIEYANVASHRMIGLKDKDIGEASLWRLIPELRGSLGLDEGALLESSVSSRELQLTYPQNRYVRLYILPFEGEGEGKDGGDARFVVILSDITIEKQSTRESMESERVSSILLLAAGVAHELGNPLNSITIHLQLMERQLAKLEQTPPNEKLAGSLEVCRNEVSRLDGIIKNFLEAVRPQIPDFQTLNLNEVLEESLEFQSNELEDRGITVEIDTGAESPIVRADKQQIKQVFFNVTKNAIEAMQPGGVIRVKIQSDEERFYLRFGDSGSGIKHEKLSHVFQPYHTTKKGGTGLGMMIVQRIMREHGGQVGIDSKEGVGTLVTLEFPKQNQKFRMLE
ncbi:MAG: PAS domain-containing sensor histidine kinase [Opitutaceae bacterium]|nr:PAS domain-containing sensor histidine kinase [Opitutaceae bacterium]